MKNRLLACGLAAVLLGTTPFALAEAPDSDTRMHTLGPVSFASGGVGSESLDRLTAISGEFNLKLVFALESGAYVSGVEVAITGENGKMLLATTSEGPVFLLKAPPGNYRVVATLSGKAQSRQATVVDKKLGTLDFRWASE
jgi:hypothetical protein